MSRPRAAGTLALSISVLEAVGFDAASTASALPIAVILLVAIPPTKLEAPYCFQNPGNNICLLFIVHNHVDSIQGCA